MSLVGSLPPQFVQIYQKSIKNKKKNRFWSWLQWLANRLQVWPKASVNHFFEASPRNLWWESCHAEASFCVFWWLVCKAFRGSSRPWPWLAFGVQAKFGFIYSCKQIDSFRSYAFIQVMWPIFVPLIKRVHARLHLAPAQRPGKSTFFLACFYHLFSTASLWDGKLERIEILSWVVAKSHW